MLFRSAGELKGSPHWKGKSIPDWIEFILKTYNQGNKSGRRMNRSQTFNQVKALAVLELGLKDCEYPSMRFVYKILDPLIEQKKQKRNPGQGPGIIIKTSDGEEILVERSNQVWQIDHTKLDNLLIDADGHMVGCVWITSVIDSYSSCIMGYYLSFMSAGSHEVALALRHAILPKNYSADYQLQKEWEVYGLPEYIVTDRAKEFKSAHLRRVALELGFKMRLRLHKEQGGIIERSFRGVKDEVSSLLPGYKGGSIKERPDNAEKYACITYEEYDRQLARYFVDHHNQHLYPRIKNQTCLQRWWSGLIGGTPKSIDERRLDICLTKEGERTVQKYGSIEFYGLIYSAGWIKDVDGDRRYDKSVDFLADYEGKITIRYDPSNIINLLVYTLEKDGKPSQYLGIVPSRDLDEPLSLREWKARRRKIRAEGKEIEQTSILAQQRDLVKFSNEKVNEMNRQKRTRKKNTLQKRHDEHDRIVDLAPENHGFPQALPASSVSNTSEAIDSKTNQGKSTKKVDLKPPKPLFIISSSDRSTNVEFDRVTEDLGTTSSTGSEVDKAENKDVETILRRFVAPVIPSRSIMPSALFVIDNSDSVDDNW